MKSITYKFSLAGRPEIHLRQPGFTHKTIHKKRIWSVKATRDSKYIHKNELDKACFQHDMAYGDFKEIPRRTV